MPDFDLNAHADTLGDPSAFFIESEGRAFPLVIEQATGLVRFVIAEGKLHPYDDHASTHSHLLSVGCTVKNPPGFEGFPAHDRTAPHFDLAKHADVIGDPDAHFVHFEAERPLVVEHATGTPLFVFEGETPVPL
jgi:hypothetical protein